MRYTKNALRGLWEKHAAQAQFCNEQYDKCKQSEKLFWIKLAVEEEEKTNHYLNLWLNFGKKKEKAAA